MQKKTILLKILIIALGSIIAAYGITLAINAGFGASSLAILWQGLVETFGISIGAASYIIAALMIIFCLFYDRRQIHIGTIINQLIYGFFVDVFAPLHQYPDNGFINFGLMLAGVLIFAIGTGIYASASFGRGSYEALTFALAEKNNWQVRHVRIGTDAIFTVTGILLGGTFGICTIATIIINGPIIQRTVQYMKRRFPQVTE